MKKDKKHIRAGRYGGLIGVIAVLLFIAACACSCRSVKVMEQVNWVDSVRYHEVYDTTRVTVTDTLHVEVHTSKTTENGTEITFGAGGGTYNSKTGEATNVTGVKESSKTQEQEDKIANLVHRLDSVNAKNEELAEEVTAYQSAYEQEKKKTRSGYDKFCSWWFWITAILLVIKVGAWLCEKIPTTNPYVVMIRRYVPFL